MERSQHWYVVASSREIRSKPVAKRRFGTTYVLWRNQSGAVICLPDRCPHRGASLSQGALVEGAIQCPYHGFRFDERGACTLIPCQPDKPIPKRMRLDPPEICEQDGWVWMWRGHPGGERPRPPTSELYADFVYGEISSEWDAHFVRVLEAQIDYTHVPFVHRTSFGRNMDPKMDIAIETAPGSFRARLVGRPEENFQFIELLYPNVWINRTGDKVQIISAFAPIDEHRCEMYVRFCQRFMTAPLLGRAIAELGAWLSRRVIGEDLPVVAAQLPQAVEETEDVLLASDVTVTTYRKMRRMAFKAYRERPERA